jgi:uncharacterized protein YdiU (UPF0061 family)
LPLFSTDDKLSLALAENAFAQFRPQYQAAWLAGMRAKLGVSADATTDSVTSLIDELMHLLGESRVDYTSFFRRLGKAARGDAGSVRELFVDHGGFDGWLSRWRALGPAPEATAGDLAPVEQLLAVVTAPYDERPGLERYACAAPEDFGPYRTFCGT